MRWWKFHQVARWRERSCPTLLHPHRLRVQTVRIFFLTAVGDWVSPPLKVPSFSSKTTFRNFWAKSQKWPVMWLLRSTNKRNVIGVTYIIFTWIEIVRFSWIFNSLPYNQCNVKDWMEQKSSVLWESDKSLNMNYGQFRNSVLLPLPCYLCGNIVFTKKIL